MKDTKLQDEAARLAALKRYNVLDTAPEAPFDKITNLIKAVLAVPMSAVSLIDSDRQWFKSCVGLDVSETARDISFCTHTIRTREPMIIPDASLDPRFVENPLVKGPPFIMSYAGVPLATPDGYNIGSLCAIDTIPRKFEPKQIDVLKSFADIVVNEFELRKLTQFDQLTGAASRRAFLTEMDKAIGNFIRHQQPAALVMFDVDHFKRVNDTYGHPPGDAVLSAIGACFGERMRPGDAFGRLGGEEFAILLNNTGIGDAVLVAERLREVLEALSIAHEPPLKVTASFGIAPLNEACLANELWLEHADLALYDAKRAGRNRCCVREAPVLVAG